jgi:hypothetical protein
MVSVQYRVAQLLVWLLEELVYCTNDCLQAAFPRRTIQLLNCS